MPSHTKGAARETCESPPEDREWFVRENLAAILAEKDRKIARLRDRVRRLEQVAASRLVELRRLAAEVKVLRGEEKP